MKKIELDKRIQDERRKRNKKRAVNDGHKYFEIQRAKKEIKIFWLCLM
jgi:hypothetical protein